MLIPAPANAPQNCGTVETHGPQPPQDPAARQAESCFWQAYQQSQPATLTLRVFGVDTVMDMASTMVNVVGNCLATVVVAKSEGQLREPAGMLEEPVPAAGPGSLSPG